ncbi:MAG: hypothetical protein ACHQCF_07120, partial [Solirubrobacterales bacterium]
TPVSGWASMRPVLLAFALAADAFVVAALGIARPDGWVPPFAVFGFLLLGFAALQLWAVRHRHDDDR